MDSSASTEDVTTQGRQAQKMWKLTSKAYLNNPTIERDFDKELCQQNAQIKTDKKQIKHIQVIKTFQGPPGGAQGPKI